jgi:hypothetical protein
LTGSEVESRVDLDALSKVRERESIERRLLADTLAGIA